MIVYLENCITFIDTGDLVGESEIYEKSGSAP
jgi:hypothetical protein